MIIVYLSNTEMMQFLGELNNALRVKERYFKD